MLSLETCKRLKDAGFRKQVDYLRCNMWWCDCGPESGYKLCHGFSEVNSDPSLKYEHYGPMYPCPNSDELLAYMRERWPDHKELQMTITDDDRYEAWMAWPDDSSERGKLGHGDELVNALAELCIALAKACKE